MFACRASWGVALPIALRLCVAFALGVALALRVPVMIVGRGGRALWSRLSLRSRRAPGSQKHQQKRAHNQ
jgi:hypothetical protein